MTTMVSDPLRWWGQEEPDAAAITFDGSDTVTYGELDAWTDNVAVWAAAVGLHAGDRLSVVGANSLEWCAGALGALKVGAVVAPFNHRLVADELRHLVASAQPAVVLADEQHMERMRAVMAMGFDFQLFSLREVATLRNQARVPFPRVVVAPDSPAVIVYTSGTTALPKGVVFTHRTIFGFILEWSLMEPTWGRGVKMLFVLALAGCPGICWGVLQCLAHGATLFVETGFVPVKALERLVDERIEIFQGVPLLFQEIGMLSEFGSADLSSLKVATVGGSRVPQATLETWLQKDIALRQIWGMTELGGSVTATDREDAFRKPESFGRGSVFTKVRVVRPDGTDCDPEEQGELICQGPGVTPGYWRNESATAEAVRDGWFHSGDVGVRDSEGYLRMVDRMKDMIISGGYNIAPAEVEAIINELPAVEEVAVISVEDAKFGETAAAIIRGTGPLTAADVVDHCNKRLAGYKVPRYVVFEDGPLPRFASGKLAKRQLREQYADLPSHHERVR